MIDLAKKKCVACVACVACEGSISAFDYSEIHKYLKKVNGWEVKESSQKKYFLEKKFKFKNFLSNKNLLI